MHFFFVLFCGLVAAPVAAVGQTPIHVLLRDPLHDPADPAHNIAAKLRLEAGACVRSTAGVGPAEAATSREKYLLRALQAVEGGYDAVNIYDRGVLSWGLMQWAAHAGELQQALWYTKRRLLEKRQGAVWANLFKKHGLDVQAGPNNVPTFFVPSRPTGARPDSWRSVAGIDALRVLFRGTRTVGRYDAAIVTRWARVFARAGRDPLVQTLQAEWATRRLRDCLNERVAPGLRVRDLTRGDLFADALTFALWTNNPAACRAHLAQAIRACRTASGEADPVDWPPGLFALLWEHTARRSRFGTWPARTANVAKQVPVGKTGRDRAYQELASRGWQIDALRRGGGRGKPWRREPAKPQPAPAAPELPSQPDEQSGAPS